ncbi:MAG: type IX secretion system membrane protein PorP/SprF, partial [Bacteroidia bacterium]|nr:type IX secretion system membrane protein PorP/SprF [Bacteroidia bacterium]MDW8333838.1 type IX secretion system membrane protein PorP/SprF [Bacteroidia bacterium]
QASDEKCQVGHEKRPLHMSLSVRSILSGFMAVFLTFACAWAQQDPQFSLYMFNQQALNPAYCGAPRAPQIVAGGRAQWIGIDGQPNTVTLTGNMPVDFLRGGVGLFILHDRIGPFNATGVKLAYAFRQPLGKGGVALQIGIGPGFFFRNLDGTGWRPPETYNDEVIQRVTGLISANNFDLDFGVFLHKAPATERENGDKFWVGFAANHLTNPRLKNFGPNFEILPSFVVTGGYRFLDGPISIVPSAFFKFVANQFQFDLNCNVHVRPMVFGLGYRGLMNTESIIGMVGFHASQRLFLAYSYDFLISALGQASSGSHELVVTYTFPRVFKYYPLDLDTKRKPMVR